MVVASYRKSIRITDIYVYIIKIKTVKYYFINYIENFFLIVDMYVYLFFTFLETIPF